MSRQRSCTGFTLVELMVTLALLMIMNAWAVPGFRSYLGNREVQTVAFELLGTLNFARSEAIKRNGPVHVRPSDQGWQGGWAVVTDPAISYETCLSSPGTCLRVASPTEVTVSGGPATVVFERSGRPSAPVPAFDLCDLTASALITRRQIVINPAGRPRLSLEDRCDG